MGILDKSATKEEFDNFKLSIEENIKILKEQIEHKVTDSEANIKNIENSVIKIEKKIKDKDAVIEEYLSKIAEATSYSEDMAGTLQNLAKKYNTISDDLNSKIKSIEKYQNEILEDKDKIDNSVNELSSQIENIEDMLSQTSNIEEEILHIKELLENSKTQMEEIEAIKNHSFEKKATIDKLYNEVYGYDIENDSGEIEHTDGVKDKLEKSYEEITTKIDNLDEIIESKINETQDTFNKLLKNSQIKFKEVSNQLETLLPGAMAAGLSSAYEEKTLNEKDAKDDLESNFKWSIIGLIFVSLIPIAIDIYRLIYMGTDLLTVIKDTPNIIISMLPIYFPILWFAYSSNKKLNLSKRLIEEYTHKAVLGKTFEGLSTQIESLSCDESVRDELRVKLLFNLLQVSSENPGKLITDYQTSDHPIMEALENSSKLSDSIEKLNKIPGLSSLIKKLENKKNEIEKMVEKDVKNGLDNMAD